MTDYCVGALLWPIAVLLMCFRRPTIQLAEAGWLVQIGEYRIDPLTNDRFDDFVTVLGKGGQGGCWCMYWIRPSSAAWSEGAKGGSRAENKKAFRRIVASGPPPGLIAYHNDEPVGWCRVTSRAALPALERSRYFKTELDKSGVWSVSCFVVTRAHRGKGLTEVLTRAAIEYARDQGATTLEAYPTDPSEGMSPAAIYTGVASTFARLGFDVVQRRAPHKPLMRLVLAPQQTGSNGL